MSRTGGLVLGLIAGGLLAAAPACGGKGPSGRSDTTQQQQPPPPPYKPEPPAASGSFLFYGKDQGLTADVSDVSPDEGGNVYVAAGGAVFAKRRADQDFAKFEPKDAGLTANCWDEKEIKNPTPAGDPFTCPVISVAGAAAGKAVIGFKGVGIDYDYDAPWALDSGGADLVTFDGTKLARDRHVLIASPPGVICEHWADPPMNTVCNETWIDSTWMSGRKKARQVLRIVVNHDPRRTRSYGDVFFGATHASISILVAQPDQRGWIDYTKGDPKWAETKGIWEHEHPAIAAPDGRFLTGESTGLAIDPTTGVPWFSNEIRTASLPGYASMSHPSWNGWWGDMSPPRVGDGGFLAFWGDPANTSYWDGVSGLSFCDDGTLYVGSTGHGLGRHRPDGSWTQIDFPGSAWGATAIACDPSDGSVWVGFGTGGFGRWKDGAWQQDSAVPKDAPQFASNPVRSIQIDRWTTPRIVYMAHTPTQQYGPGGVTVYNGP